MMAQYSRTFITLRQDRGGYAQRSREPSGRAIIEVNNGRGRVTVTAQGLRQEVFYKAYIASGENGFAAVKMGKLCDGGSGKAGLKWEFDPADVGLTGIDIDKFDVITVAVEGKSEYAWVLTGYRDAEVRFKDKFSEFTAPVKAIAAQPPLAAMEAGVPDVHAAETREPEGAAQYIAAEYLEAEHVDAGYVVARDDTFSQDQNQTDGVAVNVSEDSGAEYEPLAISLDEKPTAGVCSEVLTEALPIGRETPSAPEAGEACVEAQYLAEPELTKWEVPENIHPVVYEPRPEPAPEPITEPQPEIKPEPELEPVNEPKREHERQPAPIPEPKPMPELQPKAEPLPQPEPCPQLSPFPQPRPCPWPYCDTIPPCAEPRPPKPGIDFKSIAQKFNQELDELESLMKDSCAPGRNKSLSDIMSGNIAMSPFREGFDEIKWVRIGLKELSHLPRSCWRLGNDPYINLSVSRYKHMMLGAHCERHIYYLALPDIFNPSRERHARRLGFDIFVPCDNIDDEHHGADYGYWLMEFEG